MNKYIEAPNREGFFGLVGGKNVIDINKTVFLAGSISNAHDWQKEAAQKLLPHFTVLNPRRANYPSFDPELEREQIQWEYDFLYASTNILFFFSHETVAPITLLEYGALLEETKVLEWKKLYIAIHPEYKRKNDVLIQTELRNPKWVKNITFSLDETINQLIEENRVC